MKTRILISIFLIGVSACRPILASQKSLTTSHSPIHKAKFVMKNKQGVVASVPKSADGMTPSQTTAAQSALKSLRKLGSAAEVGVSLTDYQSRLIDAKSDVEENLRSVPDGSIKAMIEDTMQTYQDASTFWNDCLQLKSRAEILGGASGSILKKYNLTLPKQGQKETDLSNQLEDKAKQDEAAANEIEKSPNYDNDKVSGYLNDALQSSGDALEAAVAATKINDEDQQKILSAIWQLGSQKEKASDASVK